MSENGRELVESVFRDALARQREQQARGLALVEGQHRQALEKFLQEKECRAALVETAFRQAAEAAGGESVVEIVHPTIHHTELTEAQPGEPLAAEWNTYRGEVGRLLAEGYDGKFVLIKNETVVGIYDSWAAAREEGLKRYLLEPFFVHPIRSGEPYLRIRGINFPCPS